MRQLSVALLVCVLVSACGDDTAAPMCIEPLPADCQQGFEPTYDNVYRFAIQPSCGGSAAPCHGPEGRNGNLVLHEKDAAFRALLGMDGTHARVDPDDLACSPLLERLMTDDDDRRMPRGIAKLPDTTICAVQKWIEQGAKP